MASFNEAHPNPPSRGVTAVRALKLDALQNEEPPSIAVFVLIGVFARVFRRTDEMDLCPQFGIDVVS